MAATASQSQPFPQPGVAAYGAWASPISADLVAGAGVALGGLQAGGDQLFWLELRPLEGGRQVVVRRDREGHVHDVTPVGFNARTLVHEYGGGAYVAHVGRGSGAVPGTATVYFSNFEDQRLYRQDLTAGAAPGAPRAITPAPAEPRGLRYADARLTPNGERLVCVRERHVGDEVVNELVALPAGGGEAQVLASGHDFYAAPRPSPDGRRLAWLAWDHPAMPWDGTQLWVADLTTDGLTAARQVAGGLTESVLQPGWSPDGLLHFVSDRSGWWNLYRIDDEAAAAAAVRVPGRPQPATPLAPLDAEFAKPSWVFGLQNYAFLADGRLLVFWSHGGVDHLGIVAEGAAGGPSGGLSPVACPFTVLGALAPLNGEVALLGASATQGSTIALLDVAAGGLREVRRGSRVRVDPGYVSVPEAIEFPTGYEPGTVAGPLRDELEAGGGQVSAHALYYPPANRDFVAPEGEKPPLLVVSHGGPTAATEAAFSLALQFWTSRGIAVVDVNYGGSTGYGRAYRERLKGNWGIVDTVDCINAARFLAERGDVDPARLAIRGGSAGGYTTLNALTRHRFFAAGASLFGLADLEMFVHGGTHKFEAQYLLGLVGPYPERAEVYRERSPITTSTS